MIPILTLAAFLTLVQQPAGPQARLQVFLDCENCFADYLREEAGFVDFVRDRTRAVLHVIITSTGTASGGREYVFSFAGQGPLKGHDSTLKAITATGDPEDVRRRKLLTTLRIGLLPYLAADGVPQRLTVDVKLPSAGASGRRAHDRWKSWVFSVRGSGSIRGEESNKERELSARLSADRITRNWKTTFGLEIDQQSEEFDVDDEQTVKVRRRERDFNWLIVKALGEHWSAGAQGEIQSSTFDNVQLRFAGAPAVEFNVFPYSAYQRRQLRSQYSVGVARQTYYEETLFGSSKKPCPGTSCR